MTTLIGTWVACTLTLWLYIPGLNKRLPHTGRFDCLVIDDRLMSVGTPDLKKRMLMVDCSESTDWLKPATRKDLELVMREECNE